MKDASLKIFDPLVVAIDFQERLMPAMFDKEGLEQRAVTFLKGCGILGVPVVTTQQYTKGLGDTIPSIKEAITDFKSFDKMTFSCYQTDEIVEEIQKLSAKQIWEKQVVVIGVETHICVLQTVMDLIEQDYNVFVVADLVSSRKEIDTKWGLERMKRAGAVITTMESVLFEILGDATSEHRKAISTLIK